MARVAAWVGCLLGLIVLNIAWGQVDLPTHLKGTIPIYPGAEPVDIMDVDGAIQVLMVVEDTPSKIIAFYRDTMERDGWTVVTEATHGTGSTIIFSRGSRIMHVTTDASSDGRTEVVVNFAE